MWDKISEKAHKHYNKVWGYPLNDARTGLKEAAVRLRSAKNNGNYSYLVKESWGEIFRALKPLAKPVAYAVNYLLPPASGHPLRGRQVYAGRQDLPASDQRDQARATALQSARRTGRLGHEDLGRENPG